MGEPLQSKQQTFKLPLPPSVNGLYSNAPGIGRVKSKAYKAWEVEAGLRLNLQRPIRLTGPVALTMVASRPDKRRRDLMNLEKATSDLLVKHQIIEDDSLVCWFLALWVDAGEGITIIVEPWDAVRHTLENLK